MAAAETSPLPPTNPSRDFVFINDTNPGEKSRDNQKIVRAHAARGAHANFLNDAKGNTGDTQATTKRRPVRRRKNIKVKDAVSLNAALSKGANLPAPTHQGKQEEDRSAAAPGEGNIVQPNDNGFGTARGNSVSDSVVAHAPVSRSTPSTLQSETSHSSDASSTTLVPSVCGSGWVAPFVPYHETTRPYIPVLMNHYLTNIATAIPELDADTPCILRVSWFPMALTSPACLGITLLTAASHYAAWHRLPSSSIQKVLVDLKHHTLSSVNRHIRSIPPGEALPDEVLGAVAKMASYEAMFGNGELYHAHMRGLVRMVRQRGGLGMLTGLRGLMRRMMLWIDVNSAFILGGTPYFEAREPLAGCTGTTGLGGIGDLAGMIEVRNTATEGRMGDAIGLSEVGGSAGQGGLGDASAPTSGIDIITTDVSVLEAEGVKRAVVEGGPIGFTPNPGGFLSCFTEQEVTDEGIRKEKGGWDGSHETPVREGWKDVRFEEV